MPQNYFDPFTIRDGSLSCPYCYELVAEQLNEITLARLIDVADNHWYDCTAENGGA